MNDFPLIDCTPSAFNDNHAVGCILMLLMPFLV